MENCSDFIQKHSVTSCTATSKYIEQCYVFCKFKQTNKQMYAVVCTPRESCTLNEKKKPFPHKVNAAVFMCVYVVRKMVFND